jgi:hypothetical protein
MNLTGTPGKQILQPDVVLLNNLRHRHDDNMVRIEASIASIDSYNPAFAEELSLIGLAPTLSCFADNRSSYQLFIPT